MGSGIKILPSVGTSRCVLVVKFVKRCITHLIILYASVAIILMHARKNIAEIFSTFVEFEADRFRRWTTDGRLRKSIENSLKSTSQNTSEDYWALSWYNYLQEKKSPHQQKLAKGHLTAYLQEACYWTSQKTTASFTSTQYKLSDCFQIAISQIDRVLKGFNPNQGSVLKNYASVIFSSVIRETLRQRQEIDICTEWGLLRKISQKRLVASLETAGLTADTINNYVTAWNCFKTFYVTTPGSATRQLAKPDNETWAAIAKAYYSQTKQEVTVQTLESWLLTAARYARNYLYPKSTSINISASGEDSSEWIDNIPDADGESPLTHIITQEEEATKISLLSEMKGILDNALTQLDPQALQILELYYAQKQTQQDIAKKLQIQQYTVSRRLTKARETLLRSLARWSQEKLHMSVSTDILKTMSGVMEEWLQAHYNHSLN